MMQHHHARRWMALAFVNAVAAAAMAGIVWLALGGTPERGVLLPVAAGASTSAGAECCPEAAHLAPAPVARIVIPEIGVDAPVAAMGLDAAHRMEIPNRPDVVAWYDFSAPPGSGGNAVFAGHVNWRGGGEAVFRQLDTVPTGGEIQLFLDDGAELVYRVVSHEAVDIRVTSASEVIAETATETVTLITCHGEYDAGLGQFRERLIVRAERVS